jgi:hypothetical protein
MPMSLLRAREAARCGFDARLTGQRQFFREVSPVDLAGTWDMHGVLFSADGRAYVYGYSRLHSELYLAEGLK